MTQSRCGLRLAKEPRDDVGIGRQLRMQLLDDDIDPERQLLGAIHATHAALAEQRLQAKLTREDRPDMGSTATGVTVLGVPHCGQNGAPGRSSALQPAHVTTSMVPLPSHAV